MEIVVDGLDGSLPGELALEIVERKGTGHPDTICDAVAEQFSQALCGFYQQHFGLILHHNVDKALLAGGAARPAFGGGEVLEPIEIFLAGRATRAFRRTEVPVEELAREACRQWIQDHFHVLDPDRHVRCQCLVRPGSSELVELYLRRQRVGVGLANDTSCGVGFAPLSDLETLVYQLERWINSPEIKQAHPELGEDVKIMGVRSRDRIALTVACAFIDRFLADLADYAAKKERLEAMLCEQAGDLTSLDVSVTVNAADDLDSGNIYMTVTGSSAEAGDDGQVGRGNRANGLITPCRPMVMEAAAGKNPVTHVGKLYNVLANMLAAAIVEQLPEVMAAECYLVSCIGQPINQPAAVSLRLRAMVAVDRLRSPVAALVRDHLERIGELSQRVASGDLSVY